MIKLNIKVMTLILFLILTACSASNEIDPSDSIIQVGVDEITNVKVNETFQIVGYLNNSSNK
jgi:hypothetical protein